MIKWKATCFFTQLQYKCSMEEWYFIYGIFRNTISANYCDRHIPVNPSFLQNASVLLTTYAGLDCGIDLSLRMAEPW